MRGGVLAGRWEGVEGVERCVASQVACTGKVRLKAWEPGHARSAQ